jgi:hypothetical protein
LPSPTISSDIGTSRRARAKASSSRSTAFQSTRRPTKAKRVASPVMAGAAIADHSARSTPFSTSSSTRSA